MLGSILGSVINAGAGLLGAAMAPQPRPREEFRKVFNEKMAMGQQHGISKLVMAGTPVPVSQPADNSVGQAVANMGADIGNAVSRHMSAPQKAAQAIALDNAAAQNELIKAQTRSINMRTAREAIPPRPPVLAMPGMTNVPGHRMEPPSMTTHVRAGGVDLPVNPSMSDAATFENRYGETISDWFVGPAVGISDLYGWSTMPSGNPARSNTYVPLDRSRPHRRGYRSGGYF